MSDFSTSEKHRFEAVTGKIETGLTGFTGLSGVGNPVNPVNPVRKTKRRMRDSGVEWLGAVPEGWPVERLQWHLAEIVVKNDPIKTDNVLSLTIDRGVIPYSEKGNVGNKSKEDLSQYKVAFVDTIVANSMNILIGAVGLSKYEGCVSPVYYVFRAKEGNSIKYFNYLFQMPSFQKELRRFANGILEIRLRVSADDILKRQLAIPPLPEQRAIAAYLDERCAKIDAMVVDAKKLIEEYKAWKASLIFEAVTGKVGVDERCSCRMMRDSGVEWIGQVPEGFAAAKFKFVLVRNDGGVWGVDPSLDGNDKVVLRSTEQNIDGSWNITDPAIRDLSSVPDLSYYLIEEGDLLLTKSSGSELHIGKTSIADSRVASMMCYYSNFMQRLRVDREKMHDRYAWYILNSSIARGQFVFQQNATSGIGNINSQHVNNIIVPIPPLPEQREIAAYLDRKCAAIDRVVAEKEGLIADLEQYKKSLIFECVTGKREVA